MFILVYVPNALDYKARPCQWCLVISTNFLKHLLLDQLPPRYGRYLNGTYPPMRALPLRPYRDEVFKTLNIQEWKKPGGYYSLQRGGYQAPKRISSASEWAALDFSAFAQPRVESVRRSSGYIRHGTKHKRCELRLGLLRLGLRAYRAPVEPEWNQNLSPVSRRRVGGKGNSTCRRKTGPEPEP